MARNFTVTLTLGTDVGPYTIYHTQVSASNIVTISGTSNLAQNLSLSQIQSGVIVEIPDDATSVILKNVNTTFASTCPTDIVTTNIVPGAPTPTPTPNPTITPTGTPQATITPTPNPTITPTFTPTPNPTITPTFTPTPEAEAGTPTPTPTPTPCRIMDSTPYTYTYDSSSSTTACDAGTSVTVYTTGELPFTGIVLYSDLSGCNTASPGYYSNGTTYFTVDQYGEITASDNCAGDPPPPPTVYEVGQRTDTGAPFSISACGDTCDTTLLTSVETFGSVGVGTTIYSNTNGTLLAGGDAWYGIASSAGSPSIAIQINNSGVVTNDTVCPTPTPTPTPEPLPTYYRFENCDTSELVFQTNGITSEPAFGARYTDGLTNFTYDGMSTTQPGTIVTNLTGPIGTGCFDPTPTPTPGTTRQFLGLRYNGTTSAGYDFSSEACNSTTASTYPVGNWVDAEDYNTPLAQYVTVYIASDGNTPFDGGNKWWLSSTDSPQYAYLIDSTGVVTQVVECLPPTPTPTPTPTISMYTYYISATRSDVNDFCTTNYTATTLVRSTSPTINNLLGTQLFDENDDPIVGSFGTTYNFVSTTLGEGSLSAITPKFITIAQTGLVDDVGNIDCNGGGTNPL